MAEVDKTGGAQGSYQRIGDLEMYYEVHGAGQPLLMLHGGMDMISVGIAALLPMFARTRQVIAVEQQGHGHTADIDRPLTFEQMADDTAAVLRHLGITGADVFGYSDGGNVGIALALRHPELVRKLAVLGTNATNEGLYPEVFAFFATASAETIPDEFREPYAAVAPDPDNWPNLIAKVMQQANSFRGWTAEELGAIAAPALVMIGDADIVRPEHAVEMFRQIPHARLAVLPGSDHFLAMSRADWIVPMVEDFLAAPMPEAAARTS